jgi:tRNA-dihydrouridine synthase
MNIYKELKTPIISLSPMEDVTDTVFRQIVMYLGKPDLLYTEFVNVEGLNSKGKERVIHRLNFVKEEKPIVAQLWGTKPENFFNAAKLVSEMGFDGIDINMGCSVKNVIKGNAGSALITADRQLVKDIIEAVREGSDGLAISVKTRLGFGDIDMEWIQFLLNQNLDALAIHLRTAKGSNAVNANWEYMAEIVKLRNTLSPNTSLFGNGDVKSLKEAKLKAKEYNIEGVLIGRQAIINPWIFSGREDIPTEEKLEVFKKHVSLFQQTWGGKKDFNSIKKFFRAYINGFEGANELRQELFLCTSYEEIFETLQ